uniref:Uncharacterized protein n=1 Tax=Nelumbo nucifera TaxID=4432 RepID=A0A822XLZ3_NELNU|nr:TPA_asm: hypothetical protein HUJ06_024087 [Nelumbo nucifera]
MSCETNPEPKTASPSSALFQHVCFIETGVLGWVLFFGLGLSDDGGGGVFLLSLFWSLLLYSFRLGSMFWFGLSDDGGGGVLFSFTLHNYMSREAAKSSKSISLAKLILGLAKKEKGKDLKG